MLKCYRAEVTLCLLERKKKMYFYYFIFNIFFIIISNPDYRLDFIDLMVYLYLLMWRQLRNEKFHSSILILVYFKCCNYLLIECLSFNYSFLVNRRRIFLERTAQMTALAVKP